MMVSFARRWKDDLVIPFSMPRESRSPVCCMQADFCRMHFRTCPALLLTLIYLHAESDTASLYTYLPTSLGRIYMGEDSTPAVTGQRAWFYLGKKLLVSSERS